MDKLSAIGLIGLGVMGENLALNIERHGYQISIFNRSHDKVVAFVEGRGKGKKVIGAADEKTFIESLSRPRKVILLVKAGDAVDQTIDKIKPYLEKGDIIIDGGNSHFVDTQRREAALAKEGLRFIGSGVSGGEEGALWGPSLMPGGDKQAYEELRPIWEDISAKVDGSPCVTYLGPDGAGHFVKMVHNGIEYGDMQLIAEVYDVLRKAVGLSAPQIGEVFTRWNTGLLDSFLIEITAKILKVTDKETGKPLVDLILDKAGQKGTGRWTSEAALELGIPVPTIDAALTARVLSSMKDERLNAAKVFSAVTNDLEDGKKAPSGNIEHELVGHLEKALYAAKVCSYAQGMSLIKAGSDKYKWGVNLSDTARIWRGGCIIRAQLLERIRAAFDRDNNLPNLLVDLDFAPFMIQSHMSMRAVVKEAVSMGIPVPAMTSSLSYFDSYRSASLPQNLTQAQRDFFGAHTYERVDKPQAGFMHTEWAELIAK
ncbi:MAG: NADP-dependent phosphogluconate dehydrogenase [Candidatus Obscuribacter sp.]|jgi:6-phosphogluconate dehydrogenase|nr:NADP-dependent phosphogluconate dehydrogenase [Candidatus Obscuribacter sp.]MDQ5965951.1 6-phosphogluconate dehydrogenase [Cyanobacteriota bacterium erpe_2018_sw_39hr_WHONDRS-SW48-000098_B_bin.30]MBL0186930.1 NADP-dependent phosphogluconate dehydrogenase [Candidatus Obscuribacter sp.]MBP6349816.1 NADP-dependent phosphogluconate dehydrogenase [Candidatus Obscuribacter sp.]MBP6593811.1 NADP-dependent phosphogluconate dehydrogenase [Candidatus Obscuribacter sp.]